MHLFSIYWKVSGIEHSRDFPCRRNIKKPVLFPRYQGNLGGTDVPCAYVGSKEISPRSNLNIIDRSDTIPENSATAFAGESHWAGASYYFWTDRVLITDVVGDYLDEESTPFYWKHVFSSGDINPDSVAILDINLNEVPEYSYKAIRTNSYDSLELPISGSYDLCEVYSNYENSYNKETGDLDVYFVRFELDGTNHYELLNQTPAFSEAEFEDVSEITGQLKYWKRVYVIEESGTEFSITTPRSDAGYYIKPLSKGRIYLESPRDIDDNSPWFMRITDGSFARSAEGSVFYYSVPEFESQIFSPIEPYKIMASEKAERVRPNLLSLNKSPIKVGTGSFYNMDILVKDVQGNTLYVLTTNLAKDGEAYLEEGEKVYRTIETDNAWVYWDADGITGWDEKSGFVHLDRRYPDTYQFYVTYYFEEVAYELTFLNLNPIFDSDYNGQIYVLYTIPTGGVNNNLDQTNSVFYLEVNRSGQVVDCSQRSDTGNYDFLAEIEVDGQKIHYSRSGSAKVDTSVSAGTSTLSTQVAGYSTKEDGTLDIPPQGVLLIGRGINQSLWRDSSITSYPVGYSSWSNDGTSVTFTLSGTLNSDVSAGEAASIYSFVDLFSTDGSNLMQWLILAEISTLRTFRPDDLSIIDLRRAGGVISPRYYAASMGIDPRAIWARSGSLDTVGQTIPGNSAAIVKIPYTLLEDYGGSFSMTEIEEIVKDRHLAVGAVPVIMLHGAIPEIESISSTSNTVSVCWASEGDNYSYNVYYGSLKDGPWTLANESPLEDQIYGNCYTIRDLSPGLIYYVVVTSIDSNNVESPNSVAWGIRTRLT